jgi:hypothetical protein
MERQSKESRDLESYRGGGQDPPRAVAPFKKKSSKRQLKSSLVLYLCEKERARKIVNRVASFGTGDPEV